MRDLPVTVIPNPVDTRVFSPRDKTAVRREWGVDSETFVVGVGAADLRDERKQIPQTLGVLRDWMRRRQGRGSVQVLIFGAGGPLPGFPSAFRFLGPSRNASSLAEWYNAMDVYVSLSRFETFGNTLAEAAACGVPSVCITGSGMAEVVVPGQTGRHVNAPEELPEALADWVENPAQARRVGMEARTHAVRRFNDEVIARQFITLYGEPHS
jgi:glycosyltransferase involved in cell wall biosynthesis